MGVSDVNSKVEEDGLRFENQSGTEEFNGESEDEKENSVGEVLEESHPAARVYQMPMGGLT